MRVESGGTPTSFNDPELLLAGSRLLSERKQPTLQGSISSITRQERLARQRASTNTAMMAGALAALAFAGGVAGCNRGSGPGNAVASGASAGGGAVAIYSASGCARCHGSLEQGGGGAPVLTRIGSEPGQTAQWIADQIRNPRSHNPTSRMPAYEGRMAAPGIDTLARHLANLK